MSRASRLGFVLFLASSLAPIAARADGEDELTQQITSIAKPAVDAGLITGLTIGVLRGADTRVVGLGSTALKGGHLPDGKTVYEIGSVSKVFTSLLLADLATRQKVSLDDPIQKYLPPTVIVPRYHGQTITLLHLATHTSSLPRLPTNFTPRDPSNPYADYTVDQLFGFLVSHSLSRAPGDRFEYSNLGVGLLGNILGRVAQLDYERLLADRLTGPLAMTSTKVTLGPTERAQLAEGHDSDGEVQRPWDLPTLAGAGGIRSTGDDMVKFLRAQLDPPPSLRPAIELTHAPRHEAGAQTSIALGWHVRGDNKALWHNGQTGGFHSYVAIDPGHHVAVVVLANTANGAVDDIGYALLRLLAGDARVTPPKVRRSIALAPTVLDRYVGDYMLAPTIMLNVHRDGEHLVGQVTGQPHFCLYPESETHFFLRAVPAEIDFRATASGGMELVLHQNGKDITGQRHTATP